MEPEVYLRHIQNEETHWWFKSRRKIICSIIEKNLLSQGKKLIKIKRGILIGIICLQNIPVITK